MMLIFLLTDIRNRSVKHEPEMPPAITIDKPKPTYGLNENVGDLSDSSTSSSSSSGDSSDSSSDSEEAPKKMGKLIANFFINIKIVLIFWLLY